MSDRLYFFDDRGILIQADPSVCIPRKSPARPLKADGSPNYLLPGNATLKAPPETFPAGYKPVWNGSAWDVTECHIGERMYSTTTGMPVMVDFIGPIPDGNTLLPRPGIYYTWGGTEWVEDLAAIEFAARELRNLRLMACDWTQLPDSPLDETAKTAWAGYRQALRDFMEEWTKDKPWPVEPSA